MVTMGRMSMSPRRSPIAAKRRAIVIRSSSAMSTRQRVCKSTTSWMNGEAKRNSTGSLAVASTSRCPSSVAWCNRWRCPVSDFALAICTISRLRRKWCKTRSTAPSSHHFCAQNGSVQKKRKIVHRRPKTVQSKNDSVQGKNDNVQSKNGNVRNAMLRCSMQQDCFRRLEY